MVGGVGLYRIKDARRDPKLVDMFGKQKWADVPGPCSVLCLGVKERDKSRTCSNDSFSIVLLQSARKPEPLWQRVVGLKGVLP